MFKNTGKLLQFTFKREWKNLLIWLVAIVGFNYIVAINFPALYPTKEALETLKISYNIPTMRSMLGPVFGYADTTLTIAMAFSMECLLWICLPSAIMNIFLVIRNTRADEEQGRSEQVLALPVGRFSKPMAVVLCALITNMILTLALCLTMFATNIDGITFAGSLCYGLSVGSAGLIFAGVALIASELFSTASGATTFSFAVFLISFILRGIGDMKENVLSYISPLGLPLMTFPFYKNHNIWLLFILVASVIFIIKAFGISLFRDTGAGIIPASVGKADGKIKNTFGLAFKLSKITIISWISGMLLIGASYGMVIPDIDKFLKDNGTLSQLVEAGGSGSMANNYIAMIVMISSVLMVVPSIALFGRLYKEEKRNRAEQVFALPVSRYKYFASYLVVSVFTSLILPLFLSIGIYLVATDYVSLNELLKATYVYLPAILVMLGLDCFFTGICPKLKFINWIIFTYSFVVLYFGRILDLPEWANKLSPFGNISQLPVQDLKIASLYVLSGIAMILVWLGFDAYRKRDME